MLLIWQYWKIFFSVIIMGLNITCSFMIILYYCPTLMPIIDIPLGAYFLPTLLHLPTDKTHIISNLSKFSIQNLSHTCSHSHKPTDMWPNITYNRLFFLRRNFFSDFMTIHEIFTITTHTISWGVFFTSEKF